MFHPRVVVLALSVTQAGRVKKSRHRDRPRPVVIYLNELDAAAENDPSSHPRLTASQDGHTESTESYNYYLLDQYDRYRCAPSAVCSCSFSALKYPRALCLSVRHAVQLVWLTAVHYIGPHVEEVSK